MGFMDDLSNMFKKGVAVVAQKTDEYTRIGKIKVDIIGIKRDLDKRYLELGSKVYQMIVDQNNTKIATNEEVKMSIEQLKDLNNKLEQKRVELDQVREEYATKTGKPYEDTETPPNEKQG
jgi:hypothetical protein